MPEINLPTKATQDDTNTKVTTVNANVGTPASAANKSTGANAHAKLNWLTSSVDSLLTGLTVKSVQRGNVNITTTTQTINISSVNMSKSLIIVNAENGGTFVITATTSTSFTIAIGATGTRISWQVIEFY